VYSAHHFDGLDLITLLIGLSLLAGVWVVLWRTGALRRRPAAKYEESWAPKYTVGMDFGAKSRADAQMLLYQTLCDPDEDAIHIAGMDEQAQRVFEAATRNVRKPTGQTVLLPTTMYDPWRRAFAEVSGYPKHGFTIIPNKPYDWAQDPDA
jgi:hypothetical protein